MKIEIIFMTFVVLLIGVPMWLIIEYELTKTLDYEVIQNNKQLGLTYNTSVSDSGCKTYYNKNEQKQGKVCGDFQIKGIPGIKGTKGTTNETEF